MGWLDILLVFSFLNGKEGLEKFDRLCYAILGGIFSIGSLGSFVDLYITRIDYKLMIMLGIGLGLFAISAFLRSVRGKLTFREDMSFRDILRAMLPGLGIGCLIVAFSKVF